MTTSVFERLSHQGTAASNERAARERERRERLKQRHDADAVACTKTKNPAKLEALKPPQDVHDGHTKSPRRTPKEQAAFFERLAKAETVSSAAHHVHDDGDGSNGDYVKVKSPNAGAGHHHGNSAVFNRLYKQETAASKAHHAKEEKPKPNPASPWRKPAPPPSLLKRLEDKKATTASGGGGPPVPITMGMHIRTKEEKKESKGYSKLNISSAEVRRQVNLYHEGKVSAHALAFDVITALFERDFMPGAHWDIGSATLETLEPAVDKTLLDAVELEGDSKVECFQAEKEAIWDWKDIYSVATAKCIIKVSKGGVHVDEYSYYVAG